MALLTTCVKISFGVGRNKTTAFATVHPVSDRIRLPCGKVQVWLGVGFYLRNRNGPRVTMFSVCEERRERGSPEYTAILCVDKSKVRIRYQAEDQNL